jgi:hypothetical protein
MSSTKSEKAIWNEMETTALIAFLVEHKGEAGDGANFKEAMFKRAANAIAPYHTSGPAKTGKMCKTKWSSVSNSSPSIYISLN